MWEGLKGTTVWAGLDESYGRRGERKSIHAFNPVCRRRKLKLNVSKHNVMVFGKK